MAIPIFERKATGIALEADGTVRAVELIATVRTITLARMETFRSGDEDLFSSWDQALKTARDSGFDVENSVLGITDSLTYRKALRFPFRSRKRILQILESELEGEIPVPSESVIADYLPGNPLEKGISGIAIACSKQTMSTVMEISGGGGRLRGVQTISTGLLAFSRIAGIREGIAALVMGEEAVLVEIRSGFLATIRRVSMAGDPVDDTETVAGAILGVAGAEDDIVLVCRDEAASALEEFPGMGELKTRRFSDLSIEGLTSKPGEESAVFAAGFGLALRGLGRRESTAFDLRQGPFGQISPLANLKGPIKRTSALGLVIVVLLIGGLVVNAAKARREFERYSGQLEAEFKKQFPEIQYRKDVEVNLVREEYERLQSRVADMSGFDGTDVLTVLARLSSAVPAQINMKIDELSYDSNKLRIDGTVSSFDAVDKVKSALDLEPLFTEVQVLNARIGADMNRVNFRLQMEVR